MSWQKNANLFFRRHAWAWVFALVVGFLSVAPHLLAVHALGNDYRGIPFMYLDDEDIYLARMQEIADGYSAVGSPFFFEYKDLPAVQIPTGERAYIVASRLSGLTLPQTLVAAKFFLPAILFLLAYAFLLRLLPLESKKLRLTGAIVGGLLVSLGYDLLSVRELIQAVRGQDIGLHLSIWTRPVNPIIGGIGVFAYLILLWDVIERRRKWEMVASGVLLGSLVFYFFSWGATFSVTAVLLVISVFQKQWPRARDLGLVILISFLASTPYWMGMFSSIGGNDGRMLAMRNGMFFTHTPLFNKTLLAALALFSIMSFFLSRQIGGWRRLIQERWWLLSVSLLLGGLVALNQQVITGRMIWPYHFVQYTKPFVMVALLVAAIRVLSPRFTRAALLGGYIVGGFVLLQGMVAAGTYRSMVPDFRERQNDAEIFSWFNSHAPKDCVVVAKEEREHFDRLIPAFTHCNVYLSTWVFSGVPQDRVRHNFFIRLRLQGVTADGARTYFLAHPDIVRGAFFDDWKTVFAVGIDDWLLRQLDELIPAYAEFLNHPAGDELRRYRADYLISSDPLTEKEQREWEVKGEAVQVGGERVYPL